MYAVSASWSWWNCKWPSWSPVPVPSQITNKYYKWKGFLNEYLSTDVFSSWFHSWNSLAAKMFSLVVPNLNSLSSTLNNLLHVVSSVDSEKFIPKFLTSFKILDTCQYILTPPSSSFILYQRFPRNLESVCGEEGAATSTWSIWGTTGRQERV